MMACLPSRAWSYLSLNMSSLFGVLFRVATWGESHGGGVGAVVDGCPPRIPLTANDIQIDLDRSRPGQSEIVSPRAEEDKCQILSGVFEGLTLGTPISLMVWNKDARPEAYREMESAFRPSHADYTYQAKYGIRNWQGGGRASARETIGRVAAAAIAKKVLHNYLPEFRNRRLRKIHSSNRSCGGCGKSDTLRRSRNRLCGVLIQKPRRRWSISLRPCGKKVTPSEA